MMQSIAIILICIIVKLYDCASDADDRVDGPVRVAAASMPSTIVSDGNLVRVANEWQPTVVERNQHSGYFYADVNGDGGEQTLAKSSQPNKHDNDTSVMNQTENNNDSGNRIQQQRFDDDDDNGNGTRTSRMKRQSDQRQDICDTQCICRNDENFLTVECNFKQVSHSYNSDREYCQIGMDGRANPERNYFRFSVCGVHVSHCGMRVGADAPTSHSVLSACRDSVQIGSDG